MKNKIFKIIAINILAIFFIMLLSEVAIWLNDNKILHQNKITDKDKIIKFHSGVKSFELTPRNFPNTKLNYGREPVGLEYKNKKSIVIFGCSYAYGYLLNENQAFSYKLSHMTKRPVYNRAASGWGIQHMLYQTEQEFFYDIIPEPEYVIYIFIPDHLRRLYLLSFDEWNRVSENLNLRYEEKDGKILKIKSENIFLNQIKRLYTISKIQHLLVENSLKKEENYKKAQDFALKLFCESRNNMQKHWKDTKYVIYFYGNDKQQYLIDKLKKNCFIVFSSEDITDANIFTEKYFSIDYHPKEAAWDLLTPLIVEKLNL